MFHYSLIFVILCSYLLEGIHGEESGHFFLTAKSVPRIGKRGGKSSADFEKFFLKASKSVPRIGRRNENETPYEVPDNSFYENRLKYPTWAELADRFEYDPQLYSSPELLAKLEEQAGDDPSVYDWDKIRMRRDTSTKFKLASVAKSI